MTKAGAGAFVANLDSHLSMAVRRRIACDQLERVVVDAFHMQIDKPVLTDWFANIVEKFNLPAGKAVTGQE